MAGLLTERSDGGTAECFTAQQTQAWPPSLSSPQVYLIPSLPSLSLSFWFIHLPLSQCPLTLPCNILNCKNPLNPMVSIRECSRVYVFISAYASASLSFCSEFVWVTGRKQGNNSAEWRSYRQFKAINSFDYCSHLAWQCPSLAFTICNYNYFIILIIITLLAQQH